VVKLEADHFVDVNKMIAMPKTAEKQVVDDYHNICYYYDKYYMEEFMPAIPRIRPVSDLRNKFSDISKAVHESNEPVYLTKNGRGDMVVMSLDAYEKNLFESEIYLKLKEAEYQAASTKKRYTHDQVMTELRNIITKETKRKKG
jgi:prevent-host-death family protein